MNRWIIALALALFACNSTSPPQQREASKPNETPAAQKEIQPLDLPEAGEPTVVISEQVLLDQVKRFGINITQFENWGTGQIMANLVGRNPGFEGWHYRSIIEISEKTPQGFIDQPPAGGWKDGFWAGATFEVIYGSAKGRTGTIQSFQRGQQGCRYSVDEQGIPFAKGDLVVLRQRHAEPATQGWWPKQRGQGSLSAELQDIPPNSPGKQSLRMHAPGKNDGAVVNNYFDAPKGDKGPMMPLKGTYKLKFMAKGLSPGATLDIHLLRHVQPNRVYLRRSVALSDEWKAYELSFEAKDDEQQAMVDLSFKISGGTCLLDEVSLTSDASKASVFGEGVVEALKELQPGILRYWVGQLGDPLANQLASGASMGTSGYSRWGQQPKVIGFSLPEFLALCESLNADLWYVVPLTFTQQERMDLIEYLAGSEDTPMGKKRAAAGHPRPYTETVGRIFLEMGNESWNGTFKGGIIEKPERYGAVCADFARDIRSHPAFDDSVFRLVVGGQAVWAGRNRTILKNTEGYHLLSLAPYLLHKLETPNSELEPLARLFGEVAELGESGYLVENKQFAQTAEQPVELSVYEVNLHTTQGSASQDVLMKLTPSAGAGVAVAAHMLSMLSDHHIVDQCFYNLNQFGFLRSDKKDVRLWGALRELKVGGRKRPQYYALQMMNKALSGQLLQSGVAGKSQAFQMDQVNIKQPLRTYAFRDGNKISLLALNLDPQKGRRFKLQSPFGIQGTVQETRLIFDDVYAHNEHEIKVSLEESEITLATDDFLELGPAGLCLWQWNIP